MCNCGRISHGLPQCSTLSLTSASALACSLEIRLGLSMWDNRFSCASEALRLKSRVFRQQHFTCLGTHHIMSRTTVTDFRERAIQFCMCFFVCGPAVRKFPRVSGQICAGAIQFVLQILSLSSSPSDANAQNTSPFSCARSLILMGKCPINAFLWKMKESRDCTIAHPVHITMNKSARSGADP